MSKQWQIRRGTTAENNEFTGAVGELTMDTTNNTLRVHDGTTQGGHLVGMKLWNSQTVESVAANQWIRVTFPEEIDPTKIKVIAYAVIKTANNNFVVGDVIPFESLWGQNYRPLSISIRSTELQFNTSDQISTNNPNTSGTAVNIISYIRMVFDIYQIKQ